MNCQVRPSIFAIESTADSSLSKKNMSHCGQISTTARGPPAAGLGAIFKTDAYVRPYCQSPFYAAEAHFINSVYSMGIHEMS